MSACGAPYATPGSSEQHTYSRQSRRQAPSQPWLVSGFILGARNPLRVQRWGMELVDILLSQQRIWMPEHRVLGGMHGYESRPCTQRGQTFASAVGASPCRAPSDIKSECPFALGTCLTQVVSSRMPHRGRTSVPYDPSVSATSLHIGS